MSKILSIAALAGALLVITAAAQAEPDSYYHPDTGNYGRGYVLNPYLHDPDSAGADEIRELQRTFPSTNWPSSMRYYERP
jgi:hypothetical protein